MSYYPLETEDLGKVAVQCSRMLTDTLYHVMLEFRDQQREDRRPYEDAVKKSIRLKKGSFDQMQRVCPF